MSTTPRQSLETKVEVALERISALSELMKQRWDAHDKAEESGRREHTRELELSDSKFAKANEVREQIDRERGNFATRKEVEEARETSRRELKAQQDEADRRVEALEKKSTGDAGEKVGRATLTTPLQAVLFTGSGALLVFILEQLLRRTP
jgi:predicted nuclease with TOPRIM domain